MPTILLIDDDERLAELLGRYFERFGLQLRSATRPDNGLALLRRGGCDLVILDIMLPGMDGFEVCRVIRQESDIPIIMLTARGEVTDRVVGLELGADDYLSKPFEPRELAARIHSVLKRTRPSPPTGAVIRYGELAVDTERRQARLGERALKLSTLEYRLLELFAGHPGRTFTRDEILNRLRGVDTEIFSRSVDILVSRLRRKLKPADFIETVRGSGYCFLGKSR